MSINKQYILFDLDGTITDSKNGILKSMQYAVKHFGIEIKDEKLDSYSFFLGPPLRDSFKKILNSSDSNNIELAVEKYREHFIPNGMLSENKLYPGITELLKKLKNADKTVILATSKPEKYAGQILEYFDILKYFDYVCGCELDGRRSDKAEIISHCLEHFGILSGEEKAKAVMVGDRNHDITGAAKNGIESIGVLYGYGSLQELTSGEYKANYIAEDIGELSDLIL